jgi:hypothetical protein
MQGTVLQDGVLRSRRWQQAARLATVVHLAKPTVLVIEWDAMDTASVATF